MDSHKTKLDAEYEELVSKFAQELKTLREKHLKDLEKWVRSLCTLLVYLLCLLYIHECRSLQRKNAAAQEKKKLKQIQTQQEQELKVFQQTQRKDYQKSKEAMRKVRRSLTECFSACSG